MLPARRRHQKRKGMSCLHQWRGWIGNVLAWETGILALVLQGVSRRGLQLGSGIE